MRLIDADALIADTVEHYCKNCNRRKGIKNGKERFVYEIGDAPCRACATGDMIDTLEDAPTVEPKRGRWILLEEDWDGALVQCSECGSIDSAKFPFCHECGAKMEGGETDED